MGPLVAEPTAAYRDGEGRPSVRTLSQATAHAAESAAAPEEIAIELKALDGATAEVHATQTPGSVAYRVSFVGDRPADMSAFPPPQLGSSPPGPAHSRSRRSRWRRLANHPWFIAVASGLLFVLVSLVLTIAVIGA